ncbi:MAG TPA: RraA family protein [Phycisphaeraceae bacterium]
MTASCPWSSDEELFQIARRELFTAVVGDVMDKLGLRNQFLPPQIQPLDRAMVAVGRAMTVLEADTVEEQPVQLRDTPLNRPFGLMLEALDDLKPNELYVCTGASPTYALWGELMSTRAHKLGCAGAVLNGYLRDARGILAMNFPAFAYGCYAQDQAPRGRVIDFRCRIQIGQVVIRPGDIVFGDIDGVCVVPAEAEKEVFRIAIERARGEKRVKQAIESGWSAREAFDTFGIM